MTPSSVSSSTSSVSVSSVSGRRRRRRIGSVLVSSLWWLYPQPPPPPFVSCVWWPPQQHRRRRCRNDSTRQRQRPILRRLQQQQLRVAVVLLVLLSVLTGRPTQHPLFQFVVSADDGSINNNNNCAMDVWIFSSFDSCQASDAPIANGKIYADGACRTIETDLTANDESYSYFPGNYRAHCVDDGSNTIQFTDSACWDNLCTVTSSSSSLTTTTCDRDNASPGSLYSRLIPPHYIVQDPNNANVGAFYTCLKLDDTGDGGSSSSSSSNTDSTTTTTLSLTFVVFGDCSQCTSSNSGGGGGGSSTTAIPTIATLPTTVPPSSSPPVVVVVVSPAPIIAPVVTTTPPVTTSTITPATAPTTTTTTTVAPTMILSNITTSAPIPTTTTTTVIPTLSPTTVPVPTLTPTNTRNTTTPPVLLVPVVVVSNPTTTSTTKGLRNDRISVAIRLSPMNTTTTNTNNNSNNNEENVIDDSIIRQWEDVTLEQLQAIVQVDYPSVTIYANDISNITQQVIDLTTQMDRTTNRNRNQQRSLQQSEPPEEDDENGTVDTSSTTTISTGTTNTMALQIQFDVSMSYTTSSSTTTSSSSSSSSAVSLAELFAASFDTEQDRSNYLIKLVTTNGDDDELFFKSVRLVQVIAINDDDNNNNDTTAVLPIAPVTSPSSATETTSNSSTEQRSPGLFVGLATGGTALIVFAILGLVYYQRNGGTKNNNKNSSSNISKENITKEGETPSDNDELYFGYNNDGPVGPLNFNFSNSPNRPMSQQQRWTNEILVDPSADDVSTLGGSVLAGYLDPTTNNKTTTEQQQQQQKDVEDEPTASVNLDFDYHRNQYRSDVEDRSRTVMTETTGPTSSTTNQDFVVLAAALAKLGMNPMQQQLQQQQLFTNDDVSFDELYADIDDDNNEMQRQPQDNTQLQQQKQPFIKNENIANMVQPFEVRAPPGKLGMVVDTPNGGVPVVRAIKPDSALNGSVRIGDRLISVDHTDVTSMSALDVSSLISLKQHQPHRILVFCRLQPPKQQPSPPTTAPIAVTTTISTTKQNTTSSTVLVQPSPVGTEMALSSS